MKCPYNKKSETQIQNWEQSPDEQQNFTDGKVITQTVFELMNGEKENCGAYHNGRCCYAAISLNNE